MEIWQQKFLKAMQEAAQSPGVVTPRDALSYLTGFMMTDRAGDPEVMAALNKLREGEAAPELLEHLRLAVDHIKLQNEMFDDLRKLGCTIGICGQAYDDERARAALAKARGTA